MNKRLRKRVRKRKNRKEADKRGMTKRKKANRIGRKHIIEE